MLSLKRKRREKGKKRREGRIGGDVIGGKSKKEKRNVPPFPRVI